MLGSIITSQRAFLPSLGGPGVTFNFLTGEVDGRISFTRASGGADDSTGTLITYTDNQPRVSTQKGLLLEPSRTNGVRNVRFTGGTAGTIGSGAVVPTNMTITLGAGATGSIAFGIENGMDYIDVTVSGATVTSPSLQIAFDTSTNFAAVQNETVTMSNYIKLVSGSLANVSTVTQRVIERSGVGTNLATNISADFSKSVSGTRIRPEYTVTLGNASTAFAQPWVFVSNTGTPTLNYTLRFYVPQIEKGTFATYPIISLGTALTRQSETALVSALNGLVGSTEGTLVIDFTPYVIDSDAATVTLSDGTTSNLIANRVLSSDQTADLPVTTGGASQTSFTGRPWVIAGAKNKTIISWKNNEFKVANNGQPIAKDLSGTVPSVTQLALGNNGFNTSNQFAGHLSRMVAYPRAFSDAEMNNAMSSASQSVDVIIIAGQSNADGRGANTELSNTLAQYYASNQENKFIWYKPAVLANGSPSGSVVNAANLVNDGRWYRVGTTFSTTRTFGHQTIGATVGQGVTDAANIAVHGVELQLAYLHSQAYPTRELYIIKAGVSNSAIQTNWDVASASAGSNYDYFKTYCYTPSINALLAQGKIPNIMGVFWMQGEADANATDAPLYATRLQAMMDRFNTELYMVPKKICIGRLGSTTYGTGDGATVRAAQATVAGNNANTVMISTDSAALNGDNIHYSAAGLASIADLLWAQFNS